MVRLRKIPNKKQPVAKVASQTGPEADALFLQGLGLHQTGQLAQAKAFYEQVLARQPRHFDALHLLGAIASQSQNPALAAALIGKAIEINPNNASAYYNRGLALQELKRLDEAVASYDKAVSIRPDYAGALNNRGNALKDLKRLDAALASYDQAIAHKPDYAEAFYNRGVTLQELERLDEALASYDAALALQPEYAAALNNRGNALKELGRLGEALMSYDKAIAIQGDYADAFNNRGLALHQLKRLDEALDSYEQAVSIQPTHGEAFNNRGNTLQDLRRMEEALASYDKAIAIQTDYADAFTNRGLALQQLKRLDEALESYDKAIVTKYGNADAFNNRGITLQEIGRLDEALASYDQAITFQPEHVEATYNRGGTLKDLQRLDESLASYAKALTLKPDYDFLPGSKLHVQMRLCDWSEIQPQLDQLASGLLFDKKVTHPFALLGFLDKPELQLKSSKTFTDTKYPARRSLGDFEKRKPHEKIRVGYYSADFHNHATSYLMAELFEAHASDLFEFYGFSFGPDSQDEMRQRVSHAFHQFLDVHVKSDLEVAQLSRKIGIDIAVDLKGFTQDARTGIFAERCAPIQVNYLGYPGTMGSGYMDYIIADKILIPQESQQHYTEKVVYLPHSYQVNDSKRKISERVCSRQEAGLPESGFVFCCFNNNYKILPVTFDSWMHLLKTVEGSVLWLLEDNPTAARNLRQEAEARGVAASRLVFAQRANLEDHLARQQLADLLIDTLPCNAHTTASDALWAGLPVLTLSGESFAARVAASLLHAMDLPELITETPAQYESTAIELATNPELLAGIREKLARKRQTAPLFNTKLFARHIEAAFTEMHTRYHAGQQADHIYVEEIHL